MKKMLLLCLLASMAFAPAEPGWKKMKMPKNYVYIPSGMTTIDGKQVALQGFYMSKTEVSNAAYKEFLSDLERNGKTEALQIAQIHPDGWSKALTYQGQFPDAYTNHPAYAEYPVVNITREGALLYCEWLGKKLEALNPGSSIKVRLPQESEWVYAARAGRDNYPYPHGYYLRNNKGEFLYNFRHIGDETLHSDPASGDIEVQLKGKAGALNLESGFLSAPVESYIPNDFDLYNMCGNVAEMLSEPGRTKGGCYNSTGYDIRIDAPDEFAGFTGYSPFIGFRVLVSVVGK